MNRRPEIDALRGLMLVLMAVTHLPTRFGEMLGQPVGYVSAAEGFVFLSAFMAGTVYAARAQRDGIPAMRKALMRRAMLLYACQAALLVFLFFFVGVIGVQVDRAPITNLIAFFTENPVTALWGSLALLYNPPLLDILPLYIVFMLITPFILTRGIRHGWCVVMTASTLLWLMAQFGLGRLIYDHTLGNPGISPGLRIPFAEMGAFDTLAWQFLWCLGLWLGATGETARDGRTPATILGAAFLITLAGTVWRHSVGQVPFAAADPLNLLFDKWQLGPLRLISFFALLTLVIHYGPALRRSFRNPFLESLGAASLPVFCAHLVFVLLALVIAGEHGEHGLPADMLILATSFAGLYIVARMASHIRSTRSRVASAPSG